MNTKIYIAVGAVVIVLLSTGTYFYLNSTKNSTPINSETPTSFPQSNTSGSFTNTSIQIPLADGTELATADFTQNKITIEDPANAGTYYLAGNSGACKPDGTCPTAGNNPNFTVVYNKADGSFMIGIAAEPLSAVRKEAEQYLLNALRISESSMCNLRYYIGTTSYVSAEYGGKNLGFSFCPNAVILP